MFRRWACILVSIWSCAASAGAEEKFCTPIGGAIDLQGYSLVLKPTLSELRFSPYPHQSCEYVLDGEFKFDHTTRVHKQRLVQQRGYSGSYEGQGVEIWLDEALLQPNNQGEVEITWHAEGKYSVIYSCRP